MWPMRLHAFNRFELKYLVPVDQAAEIRDELAERMDTDPHSPVGGYGVWSLYYDSPQLRFYWEKIEGLKFRRKLRIRHYGNLDGVTDDSMVCVEIKQRVNRVTQKRRIMLPYGVARQLCDDREMPEHSPKESAFIQEVLALVVESNLRPTAITGYQREALVGRRRTPASVSPSTGASAAGTGTSTSAPPRPRTGSRSRRTCRSWRSR